MSPDPCNTLLKAIESFKVQDAKPQLRFAIQAFSILDQILIDADLPDS